MKEYYDYSGFSTCIESSQYFWETIATEFLRNYHDSKAVALKEYYDSSPISTYTESCWYFQETVVTVKLKYKKEICSNRKFGFYEKHILASELFL